MRAAEVARKTMLQQLVRSMTPMETVRRFFSSEEGLVTVEWVALAGAVVIGGITVVWIVLNNLQTPANSVGSNLTAC